MQGRCLETWDWLYTLVTLLFPHAARRPPQEPLHGRHGADAPRAHSGPGDRGRPPPGYAEWRLLHLWLPMMLLAAWGVLYWAVALVFKRKLTQRLVLWLICLVILAAILAAGVVDLVVVVAQHSRLENNKRIY